MRSAGTGAVGAPYADIVGIARLTTDEEQGLARRKVAGDVAARDELIVRNIPLALAVASRFAAGPRRIHADTLVSVAVEALVVAADGYDPGVESRGSVVRFGSYAVTAIRNRLLEAVHRDLALIPVPRWVSYAAGHGGFKRPGAARPSPSFAESHARAKVARGCCASGDVGVARGMGVESLPDRDARPGGMHPSSPDLDRAISRLAGRWPVQAAVVRLMFPLDGSDPLCATEAGGRLGMNRQAVYMARFYGLRNLRRIIEEQEAAA